MRLAYVNIFARDIEKLSSFYSQLLGFPEIEGHRSPIYRCLDVGGLELGFNALDAYKLLGLDARAVTEGREVRIYPTFEAPDRASVDAAHAAVGPLGGRAVKAPYETYYNAWQTVLEDPEGNVFRVNHRMGPRRPAREVPTPPWATT